MKEKFIKLYMGHYSNKCQALSRPCFFSYINISHELITDNWFFGSQQKFLEGKPYRQFVVNVVEENDKIFLKSYKLNKKKIYTLEEIKKIYLDLEYNEHCDIIYEYDGEKFNGNLLGNKCQFNFMGTNTYVNTKAILDEVEYRIYDVGYLTETDEFFWGSNHGYYSFMKTDK